MWCFCERSSFQSGVIRPSPDFVVSATHLHITMVKAAFRLVWSTMDHKKHKNTFALPGTIYPSKVEVAMDSTVQSIQPSSRLSSHCIIPSFMKKSKSENKH